MNPPRVVLTDACVLINLAVAERLPLLDVLPDFDFRAPEEVLAEIRSPRQRNAIEDALGAGFLRRMALTRMTFRSFRDLL